MKVAAYYGPGSFKVEERPLPETGDDEMLVKVEAVGICGSDTRKAVHQTVPPGTVLGHEVAGTVERVGKEVRGFRTGDRVALAHRAPCMTCRTCLRSHPSLCDQHQTSNLLPGGFSQYVKVGPQHVRQTVYPIIRDSTTMEEAAFMEPLACCLSGFLKLDFHEGDSVLIIGAGPIGLQHLMVARHYEAGTVAIVDLNPERLKVAKVLGADVVLSPRTRDSLPTLPALGLTHGFDNVIVTVAVAALYEQAIGLAGKGASVLVFAETPRGHTMSVEPCLVYSRELRIVGSYSYSPRDLRAALDTIENGRAPVRLLISDRVALDGVGQGIDRSQKAQDCLKIMVLPNG